MDGAGARQFFFATLEVCERGVFLLRGGIDQMEAFSLCPTRGGVAHHIAHVALGGLFLGSFEIT